MTPETAIVKLMWAIGRYKSATKVKKLMQTNIAGEINEKMGR